MTNKTSEAVVNVKVTKTWLFYPVGIFCYIFGLDMRIDLMVDMEAGEPRFK